MALRKKRVKAFAVTAAAGIATALTIGLSAASNAATSGAMTGGTAGDPGQHVQLDRVFVIMLENHSQASVVGDPNMPFLSSLAQSYGQASSYYGVTHPSQPNYVAMISGSNWFINNDSPANRYDHTNLIDALDARHISWGAYMEAMPAADPLTDYWPSSSLPLYASKHNPFALFTDIRNDPGRVANIKPYTSLAGDLNGPEAPRFVFISPDQCNDLHGGIYSAISGYPETPCPYNSVNNDPADVHLKQNADSFIQGAVTTIMSSRAWTPHSAIFIVADEGDYTGDATTHGWGSVAGCCDSPVLPAGDPDISATWPGGVYGGGLVPAVIIDPSGPRHYVSDVPYNHYSFLLTVEEAWNLPELGFTSDHAQVTPMNEFLTH